LSDKILELKEVSMHFPVKKFGRKEEYVHAMDNISFSLSKGEILAIVGESGSGKTTIANVVAKLHQPTSGKIYFDDQDIYAKKVRKNNLQYRKNVQMIFQDPFGALNPTHTIRSILERPFIIHNLADRKNVEEKIKEVLIQVGLEPPEQFIDKFPHELSGGQLQRINIARAISVEPVLLLADEPTSMLDVSIRIIIMNMIKKFREEDNISYLYITHNLAGARYIADRIGVMYAGILMELGPADEIIQNAFHPYTQLLRSAAPQPEKGFKDSQLTTQGEIPSLINPPSGCRFHPRCPKAMPECSKKIPEMIKISENHQVRCLLY
jgi:peptide/nickel transport system ATP-binding protein